MVSIAPPIPPVTARTILYGDEQVPVYERSWSAPARMPYRKTYALKPGQQWQDMPVTEAQWEHYVVVGADALPVGVVIRPRADVGGCFKAVFTEQWGGLDLISCASTKVERSKKYSMQSGQKPADAFQACLT